MYIFVIIAQFFVECKDTIPPKKYKFPRLVCTIFLSVIYYKGMKSSRHGQDKFTYMTQTPVKKLVGTLAVPTMISMLVTSIYNLADTYFAGQIGTSESAAIGIALPLMAIIQALGFMFGHGSGNYISRLLGSHRGQEADRVASVGFFSAFIAGGVLGALGLIFLSPFVRLLGATETSFELSKDYIGIVLIGTPFMMSSLVLNNQLRFQGSAFYAMAGIVSGAVLNIALDPIFMFACHMGVAGAALATVISQFVGFVLLLIGCSRGENIHIRLRNFRPGLHIYRRIFGGGLPSLCRQGLASVAAVLLNLAAKPYGDAAIAAMSIVSRITMFASSALLGFGQGFQPVCGFNYGAKLYQRVRDAFFFCVKVAAFALIAISVLGFVFAPQLVTLFRDDPEVIKIGALALRMQCVSFPFMAWLIPSNMLLQTIGKTFKASVVSLARQGLCFLPFILILPRFYGILGIQLSQPIADVLSVAIAVPLTITVLRELKRLQIQEKQKGETMKNHDSI